MGHLQLQGISHSFGARDLLVEITFSISGSDRVALTGANGSGKSTLMRIMAGELHPESGRVVAGGETTTAYLPQSGVRHTGRHVWYEVDAVYDPVRDMISQMEDIGRRLEEAGATSRETNQLIHRHSQLSESIRDSGYWSRERHIHRVLSGLGFDEGDFSRATGDFSAGWRMRVALAKVLLQAPDVLLLDEPTNYLDIEARDWLENYLDGYVGAVMVVSHDRYFLDRTVNKVAELYLGKLGTYRGNFSQYEEKRRAEMQEILSAYEQQQEEIARLESFIQRFRSNASKAALVQSRVKQLEKMDRIEIPESLKRVHLSFPPPPHSGRQVLRLRGVSRRYGGISAVEDVDLQLERGDKLVLVGPNGAGKSTLMRIIAGTDQEYTGERELGSGVDVGFFSQDAADHQGDDGTVFTSIEAVAGDRGEGEIRNLLGAFLFHGDDVFKPVSVLSGGERSRLELLKLLLSPRNLLVLDEPTNHLDMTSKSVLLEALSSYSGTVVFVSHDRYFMDQLAETVLELRPPDAGTPRARLFPGDYEYYRRRIEAEQNTLADSREVRPPRSDPSDDEVEASEGKKLHEASKRARNEIKRLGRREEELLLEIDQLETEKAQIERELADPTVYADPERARETQTRLSSTEQTLSERQREWESVLEELEALESQGA
jgi:ATP-binding cassette subfamily F protein 3